MLNLVGYIALSVTGLMAVQSYKPSNPSTPNGSGSSINIKQSDIDYAFIIGGVTIAGSFLLSIGYFMLMQL